METVMLLGLGIIVSGGLMLQAQVMRMNDRLREMEKMFGVTEGDEK